MGKFFGTDGFRGTANVTITVKQAFMVGRFLGWYFTGLKSGGEHARIVIGKDTRRSSYMLEYALISGLVASGADAYMLHVTTTPSVSYVTRADGFDCGVMISASHNPYYDNGIKLLNGAGEKMEACVIDRVEAYLNGDLAALGVEGDDLPLAKDAAIGQVVDHSLGRNRYVAYLISLAQHSFRPVRVGLDCANGSAWAIARNVFNVLRARTFVMGDQPDGLNINREVGSTHIEALCQFVKDNQLDVGFAFDGDADRCIAVDENGNVVNGDLILYICGLYLKQRGELTGNTVVTTVMSNFGLYKALEEADIRAEKTQVGDKYVYECMVKNGYRLGGEQSGHIIFSTYACTGDGILTALMLMQVMLERKMTLGQLAKPVTIYPQVLRNVRVRDKAALRGDEDVKQAVQAVQQELGDTGRVLVRESGTEPLVRVMVEAPDKETCQRLADSLADLIEKKDF